MTEASIEFQCHIEYLRLSSSLTSIFHSNGSPKKIIFPQNINYCVLQLAPVSLLFKFQREEKSLCGVLAQIQDAFDKYSFNDFNVAFCFPLRKICAHNQNKLILNIPSCTIVCDSNYENFAYLHKKKLSKYHKSG